MDLYAYDSISSKHIRAGHSGPPAKPRMNRLPAFLVATTKSTNSDNANLYIRLRNIWPVPTSKAHLSFALLTIIGKLVEYICFVSVTEQA